jgi:hypothetical protein
MFDLYLILSYLGLSVCLYLLTPYPILSQHTCGNVPLITLSLTHYLILSYLPILTQKVGGSKDCVLDALLYIPVGLRTDHVAISHDHMHHS